ncbi:hypothetical protein AVEN_134345-1 [Araneus ventricosus]|uniref:Uncharacterized protein n=1 Tax=Araneus ventricosus TaxID=182803 RepID=A0A4Y2FT54_ARAVE|nr:hypothetical protein AVEN_230530-1 [Araneus ventricosus]GBM43766.1 hypothetical protein AVEN_134345-1 [Araneus ventricosus]
MREFKTSGTSTPYPQSSSLNQLSFLYFGDGRSRFTSSTSRPLQPIIPLRTQNCFSVLSGLSSKTHPVSPSSNKVPSANSSSKTNFLKFCAAHFSVFVYTFYSLLLLH